MLPGDPFKKIARDGHICQKQAGASRKAAEVLVLEKYTQKMHLVGVICHQLQIAVDVIATRVHEGFTSLRVLERI